MPARYFSAARCAIRGFYGFFDERSHRIWL